MSPQTPKRSLTKGESTGKETPSKRPRSACEIIMPMVTKDNGAGLVRNVKSENVTEDAFVDTLSRTRRTLSLKDLPPECLPRFRVTFMPAVRDLVGTLGPWESPADADVMRIWDACFPKHKLEASKGLQYVVFKLVDDAVQHWRWKIGATAVECVNMNLRSWSNRESERVARAAWLLGDDEKDRKRPFYYKKYQNGNQPSGIFQSPIIAATLATHLAFVSHLPEESRLQYYPTGALALSILALKRALTWAKTGVDSIPQTPEGSFSRVNWGDHYNLENGRYVLAKTASNIVAVVDKLRDTQWERILAEAEKCATKNTISSKIPLKEEAEERQSDFELEDWDDDFE